MRWREKGLLVVWLGGGVWFWSGIDQDVRELTCLDRIQLNELKESRRSSGRYVDAYVENRSGFRRPAYCRTYLSG